MTTRRKFVAPARTPLLPTLQTISEQGYPSVQMSAVFGMVARCGTPQPLISRLYEEISMCLKHPKFAKRFEDLGFEQIAMNPDEFRGYIARETDRQGDLIKAANISVE